MGLISGPGRCPGEENGNLPQHSYLGNPMDRRAWQAVVNWFAKDLDMTWQLNNNSKIHFWILKLVYAVV